MRASAQLALNDSAPDPMAAGSVERFVWTQGGIERIVIRRDRSEAHSLIAVGAGTHEKPIVDAKLAELHWLRAETPPPMTARPSKVLRFVDLFSGCGGLSLGIREACRAIELGWDCRLALDYEESAAGVFRYNFPGARVEVGDVTRFFDGELAESPTLAERRLKRSVGEVDLLVGGPPCQGHSDLNNRTRRRDGKNELYLKMVRAAEVLCPEFVIIENVPGALNDHGQVVQRAADHLERLGYEVDVRVIDVSELGVAQRRKRLVLVASRRQCPSIAEVVTRHRVPTRNVAWAIRDLVDRPATTLLDTPTTSAPATRARIAYLFEHDVYELPNEERPPCHSNGNHSYSSIYGRVHWDRPSQTITTGFYSMCMGRYVHPSRPRTLTAHEAARIQYFPDWFDFHSVMRRTNLARIIGNAVPPRLSYVLTLEMLR